MKKGARVTQVVREVSVLDAGVPTRRALLNETSGGIRCANGRRLGAELTLIVDF